MDFDIKTRRKEKAIRMVHEGEGVEEGDAELTPKKKMDTAGLYV